MEKKKHYFPIFPATKLLFKVVSDWKYFAKSRM